VLKPLCRAFASAAIAIAFGPATPPAQAQCNGFVLSQSSGAVIEPGTTDIGNHGVDVVTTVALPFPITIYGVAYTSARVTSNGNMQFTTSSGLFTNSCLPAAAMGVALLPHWDDMQTSGTGRGIYTSVTGVAPGRVFNVEWRTFLYGTANALNFQARLFEDNSKVEFIYGVVAQSGSSATIGIQHATEAPTQFGCNSGGIAAGLKLTFTPNTNPALLCAGASAAPATMNNCGGPSTTLLTVWVTPGTNPPSTGITVAADLSAIGGSAAQAFYDDGTNGDVTPGNNTFSFRTAVPAGTSPGGKAFAYSIADFQGRAGSGVASLTVTACPTAGPDVYIGDLSDVDYYGQVGDILAYAVGTNACNQGDVPVLWIDHESNPNYDANQHPVIAQNFYRLKNNRFEQIGQSWLKHGFVSTNSGFCGTCSGPPLGGDQLGLGCSDLYSAGLNGSQGGLGPRSQVNATTGAYPFPYSAPAAAATIGRRLQVHFADVDPAQNAGALYYAEGHYVTADDAAFTTATVRGNGLNNMSWRRISMTTPQPAGGDIPFIGATVRQQPAIMAWPLNDPSVVLFPADYLENSITARFYVGAKVTSNGNGTWNYEYAVHNINSNRAGGSFSVPLPPGAQVTGIGFHDVDSHSGEPFSLADWAPTVAPGGISWATQTFAQNANALRWGTLYNFRFTANVAPNMTGSATIGLFAPGAGDVGVVATVPAPLTPTCGSADFDNDGDTGTDQDIETFFACIGGNCCPLCGTADFDGDGDTGTDLDIEAFFRVMGGGPC